MSGGSIPNAIPDPNAGANPAANVSSSSPTQTGTGGQTGATGIGNKVKDIGTSVKGVAEKMKGKWTNMDKEEKGYLLIAALCFLVAAVVLVGIVLVLGPASLPLAALLISPLVAGGSLAIYRLRLKRAERKAAMPPEPPKMPSSVADANDWKKKLEEMLSSHAQYKPLMTAWNAELVQLNTMHPEPSPGEKANRLGKFAQDLAPVTQDFLDKKKALLDIVADAKEKEALAKEIDRRFPMRVTAEKKNP